MARLGRLAFATAFGVSVALNVVAAGFFLERAFDRPARGPERMAERATGVLVGRVPDEVRDPLVAAVLAQRAALDEAAQALRASRRAVREAMRAEPLDIERLRDALATMRERSSALFSVVDDAVVAELPKLSPAQRAQIRVPGGGERQPRPAEGEGAALTAPAPGGG
jgi:uncharacterized membrane protein